MAEKKLKVEEMSSANEATTWFEKLEGFEVKSVRLHTALEAPGAFPMERTISDQKAKGIKMKFDGNTLWFYRGKVRGFIPAAAINGGVLE